MKKFIIMILSVVMTAFATEVCNNGNPALQIPLGSCYNDGYLCEVCTENYGSVRFSLGKTDKCLSFENTHFVTFPVDSQGALITTSPQYKLRVYLVEDPADNVGAMGLAINSAFIINALNEQYKVRVIYHRVGNVFDVNSIRLQGISKLE